MTNPACLQSDQRQTGALSIYDLLSVICSPIAACVLRYATRAGVWLAASVRRQRRRCSCCAPIRRFPVQILKLEPCMLQRPKTVQHRPQVRYCLACCGQKCQSGPSAGTTTRLSAAFGCSPPGLAPQMRANKVERPSNVKMKLSAQCCRQLPRLCNHPHLRVLLARQEGVPQPLLVRRRLRTIRSPPYDRRRVKFDTRPDIWRRPPRSFPKRLPNAARWFEPCLAWLTLSTNKHWRGAAVMPSPLSHPRPHTAAQIRNSKIVTVRAAPALEALQPVGAPAAACSVYSAAGGT